MGWKESGYVGAANYVHILPPKNLWFSDITNAVKNATTPVNAALFGLYEALMGSEGKAHSAADVAGYMRAAGFANVSVHDFLGKYIRRVTGKKKS